MLNHSKIIKIKINCKILDFMNITINMKVDLNVTIKVFFKYNVNTKMKTNILLKKITTVFNKFFK